MRRESPIHWGLQLQRLSKNSGLRESSQDCGWHRDCFSQHAVGSRQSV